MTTKEMEWALASFFDPRKNLLVPNVSWGLIHSHECDLLVMRKSGYAIEVEIKISKQDLKKDFSKKHSHGYSTGLFGGNSKPELIRELYYAVPEKLKSLAIELVEENCNHAGIYVVTKEQYNPHAYNYHKKKFYYNVNRIKKAKTNTSARMLNEKERFQLARLGCLRYWSTVKKKRENE